MARHLESHASVRSTTHRRAGERFVDEEAGTLVRRAIRHVFTGAVRVVVLSGEWREWVTQTMPGTRVLVIPNCVRLPALPARRRQGEAGETVLLFMGRIGRRKGIYDLLHALSILRRERGVAFRLQVGGDGEVERARDLAERLGIGKAVCFKGWLRGQAKDEAFREADLYVLPSYNEGLPMSVLEAMSFGLPVVTTPVGGTGSVVTDGDDGYLVAPGDIHALADRLQLLIENRALRCRMGRAARQTIEQRFSGKVVCAQWAGLYRELLDGE